MEITKLIKAKIAREQAEKLYEMIGTNWSYMYDDLETVLRNEAHRLIQEAVKLERDVCNGLKVD